MVCLDIYVSPILIIFRLGMRARVLHSLYSSLFFFCNTQVHISYLVVYENRSLRRRFIICKPYIRSVDNLGCR